MVAIDTVHDCNDLFIVVNELSLLTVALCASFLKEVCILNERRRLWLMSGKVWVYRFMCAYCCWLDCNFLQREPRKQKYAICATCLRATCVIVTKMKQYLPSQCRERCSNNQLRRRQGFVIKEVWGEEGGFGEWLRVWCGVQWWRRVDTADSVSTLFFFLQPLLLSWSTWVGRRKWKAGSGWGKENRRGEAK